MSDEKVTCNGCGWRGQVSQLLRAADPFNAGDELTACPQCRQQEELSGACEQEGCWKNSTCGGPAEDGVYRRTCSQHAHWLRASSPGKSD